MPELGDVLVAAVSGIYLIGGLVIVAVFLAVDHVLFRRRNARAIEAMRAEAPRGLRAPVFDIDVDDDWRGFA